MMKNQGDNVICHICEKSFSSTSSRNQHMRKFHSQAATQTTTRRIICPLCSQSESFVHHLNFRRHLLETHNINTKISTLHFRNIEEFQFWRSQDGREENYSCRINTKYPKGIRKIVYNCIRSNTAGYKSKCRVRRPRKIGSQYINGFCPSKITATIAVTGEVSVDFVETHVGHEDDIGYKRLTKAEETKIRDQLIAGVTMDKILQDAKIVNDNTFRRINLLTRQTLRRIIRTYNINNQRQPSGLMATSPKVEVCSKGDKNNTNLKHNSDSISEKYEDIQDEDSDLRHTENLTNNTNENNLNVGDRDNLQESTSAEEQLKNKTASLLTQICEQINIMHKKLSLDEMATYVEELKLLNKRFLEGTWNMAEICKKIKIEKQTNFPSET